MDDTRIGGLFKKLVHFIAIPLRVQAKHAGAFGNGGHLCPVTGDAAELAKLRQRNPFPVVGKYHGKRSSTALHVLHLHDDWYPCYTAAFRCANLLFHQLSLPVSGRMTAQAPFDRKSRYKDRPPGDSRSAPCSTIARQAA